MATKVEIDVSEMKEFFANLTAASKGFREKLTVFLDGIGFEFLDIVAEEIIKRKVMDTRLLLNSFTKGKEGNVWEIKEGGLTLEVGTIVNYAKYVNDGHWTNKKGMKRRFVPGRWETVKRGENDEEGGSKFVYDPSAKGGMVLNQKWVEGRHYWDEALKIMEKVFPQYVERMMGEWIDEIFS